ncbi:MAG: C-terminal binding protein [Spirochaetaceae bacterium]|nr:C-terminal binding protein [Spirochaetaceae bacterium]
MKRCFKTVDTEKMNHHNHYNGDGMPKFRVFISDYDYPDNEIEKKVLEPIGAEVIGLQCKTGEGLAELAADADAILQQYAKIPRSTIEKLHRCKAICRYGIGVDIVDVNAAYEHGMVVTNVPDYALDEVADHSIALALMLVRRVPEYDRAVRAGTWHWSAASGVKRLRDSVWGFIGFGRIAQNTARKIRLFGFDIRAHDPFVSESYMATMGVRKVDLATILKESDVVDVVAPLTNETEGMLGVAELRSMKQTAVLVNCARGKIVKNDALVQALENGWIAAAGLDDLEEEPAKLSVWSPEENPLLALPNCVITPHVAYVSEASLQECRHVAAENARAVLLGKVPPNIVNPTRSV